MIRIPLYILVLLCGALSHETARGEAPVVWNGSKAKSLAATGFQQNDGKDLRILSVNPTAGGGISALIGSVGMRNNSGAGEFWLKTGIADTAWTLMPTTAGTGDVVGPASSVDSELALFSGTTGKLIKRASGTGYAKLTSGVLSAQATPIPVADGGSGTTSAFTLGSVVFAGTSGVYSQNNANFFWDDTNARLGLGLTSPGSRLVVKGTTPDSTASAFNATDSLNASILYVRNDGRVGINDASPGYALEVTGDANLTAATNAYRLAGANALSFPSTDTTAGASIAIGNSALASAPVSAAYNAVAIGYQAMGGASMTTGAINDTAVGRSAGAAITSASNATLMGYQAGINLLSGLRNSAFGAISLSTVTTNSDNAAFGYNAGASASGNQGAFFGAQSGRFVSSGSSNTCFGYACMQGITGTRISGGLNTGVGQTSLSVLQGAATLNTAIGAASGSTITTGSNNVVMGPNVASVTLTTGSNNILIGTTSAVDTVAAATSNTLNIGASIFGSFLNNQGGSTSIGINTNAPGSTFQVAGSYAGAVSNLAANTTLDATNQYVTVDASGAARTITLPECASTIFGRVYYVKKIDSSANAVTVSRLTTSLIDGATTSVLSVQYQARTFVCTAANVYSVF